jgi:hypothetical protein
MPRSLLGETAAPLAVGRFDHARVKPAGAHQLPRPVEAACLADLGEQVAREDRADTEDRLQRLTAPVGARVAAQLALDKLELLFQPGDHRDDHVDLRSHMPVELERGDPAATLRGQEPPARAGPALVRE